MKICTKLAQTICLEGISWETMQIGRRETRTRPSVGQGGGALAPQARFPNPSAVTRALCISPTRGRGDVGPAAGGGRAGGGEARNGHFF